MSHYKKPAELRARLSKETPIQLALRGRNKLIEIVISGIVSEVIKELIARLG